MRTPLSVDNRGFTLIEVIVVMILMAIFAMLAVSRQPQTDMTLKAGAEVLKSHLRYAQARAMSSDSGWGIAYRGTEGSYWLFKQDDLRRFTLPGETQNSVNLASNAISIDEGDFNLTFDQRGRPSSTLAFNARQILLTLSKTGTSDETITILQNTGFIR
jgi:prepilin-type N-terminal cleavage/methylation domain-containing protein